MTAQQWSYVSELRNDTLKFDSNSSTSYSPNQNSTTSDLTTNDPMTQGEEEDRIIDWLESHGVNDGWKLASDLVNAGITIDKLNDIAHNITSFQSLTRSSIIDNNNNNTVEQKNLLLEDILSWLNATTRIDRLVYEIKTSTTQISKLISAVKSYSYMD